MTRNGPKVHHDHLVYALWSAVDGVVAAAVGGHVVSMVHALSRSVGFSPSRYSSLTSACPWPAFVDLLAELESHAGGPLALEQALRAHWGTVSKELGNWRGVFSSDRALLRYALQVLLPAVLPGVAVRLREHEVREMRVDVRIVPTQLPSAPLLRLLCGAVSQLPQCAGFSPVRVTAEVTPNLAHYQITTAAPLETPRAARVDVPQEHGVVELQDRLEMCRMRWTLTPRQLDILRALCQGLANKEIAARLGIVEGTVELHITHVFRKAGVTSRTGLMARFWEQ